MQLIIEDRVEQVCRHLQPHEVQEIESILTTLKSINFENLSSIFTVRELNIPDENVYILRATPRLRILFKYIGDQTLIIEDVVSHDVLKNFLRR